VTTKNKKDASSYGASSIKVLKGLDPIKKRPGMYTRTDCPNHIIQEVIDNAQDEALAGEATEINVKIDSDGSVTVSDNGRGIPTAIHPDEGVSTLEVVFSRLHSGGKFDSGGDNAYSFAGGLHGVGVSVTNALSEKLEVTVYREGNKHTLGFSNGIIVEPLTITKLPKEEKNRTGTTVRSLPNGSYFDSPNIQISEMESYLKAKAVLLPNTKITYEKPGKEPIEWNYPGGMAQYLEEEVGEQGLWVSPVLKFDAYHDGSDSNYAPGEGFSVALGWLELGRTTKESYVNLIPTIGGGKHENGLKAGVFEAIRNFSERLNLVPKGTKIETEDVWGKLSFVLSTKLLETQFQGQTKDKLTSPKAVKLVQNLISDNLELWLNDNLEEAKKIVDLVVQEAVDRNRNSTKTERKRSSSVTVLPGKLSDCQSKDVDSTELFLVEGDSAGGSAKQGRDRNTQAILPLRGKLLNTWESTVEKVLSSDSVGDIALAIGVEPHKPEEADTVDLSKLRYGKIVIMADADVDGLHIQVLLLTLFFKHFMALIKNGHIYIAQSPLYRIDAPAKKNVKKGESSGRRRFYALDEKELKGFENMLTREGLTADKWTTFRFKGLGEMNPEQLKETTMNPDTRRMLQIDIKDLDGAMEAFDMMMVTKNSGMRREWMEKDGHSVEYDS